MSASDVLNVNASCGCAAASIAKDGGDKQALLIRYDPHGRSGPVHERVILRLNTRAQPLKVIDIHGEVIPGWYARPAVIEAFGVGPEERRSFTGEIRIQYDLPDIIVEACDVTPPCPGIAVTPSVDRGARSIIINGRIDGAQMSGSYKGTMIVRIGPGPTQVIAVRIVVWHVGVVRSDPETVTLFARQAEPVGVRCIFAGGKSLRINGVDSPEWIDVQVERAEADYVLKVRRKHKVATVGDITISQAKINVFFDGMKEPLVIPVICLP